MLRYQITVETPSNNNVIGFREFPRGSTYFVPLQDVTFQHLIFEGELPSGFNQDSCLSFTFSLVSGFSHTAYLADDRLRSLRTKHLQLEKLYVFLQGCHLSKSKGLSLDSLIRSNNLKEISEFNETGFSPNINIKAPKKEMSASAFSLATFSTMMSDSNNVSYLETLRCICEKDILDGNDFNLEFAISSIKEEIYSKTSNTNHLENLRSECLSYLYYSIRKSLEPFESKNDSQEKMRLLKLSESKRVLEGETFFPILISETAKAKKITIIQEALRITQASEAFNSKLVNLEILKYKFAESIKSSSTLADLATTYNTIKKDIATDIVPSIVEVEGILPERCSELYKILSENRELSSWSLVNPARGSAQTSPFFRRSKTFPINATSGFGDLLRVADNEVFKHLGKGAFRMNPWIVNGYDVGGYFIPHFDNGTNNDLFPIVNNKREHTAIIFLNDQGLEDNQFTGGDLFFPEIKLCPRIKIGKLALFNASRDFLHMVTPVKSGYRLVLTAFFTTQV